MATAAKCDVTTIHSLCATPFSESTQPVFRTATSTFSKPPRRAQTCRNLHWSRHSSLRRRIRAMTRATFKFSARTRVAFSDTDAQGVVYYGRYNPYFDLARVEYLRMLGQLHRDDPGEFVMRANDVEYFAPARFDDELEIDVRVSRIGTTSGTFEF